MKRLLLLALLPLACAPSPASRTVRIAGASSLRDLLMRSMGGFAVLNMGGTTSMSFGASSTISRQIESGAPIDVFISADAENLDRLGSRMNRATRRVVLINRLALVVRDDATGEGLNSIPAGTKIAIAGPEVPAGKAWRKYLAGKGLLAGLEPRFVVADDVRSALALFDSSTVDAALVYATDVPYSFRKRRSWTPPDGPAIEYVAAAVAGSGPLASELVEYLRSKSFQDEAVKAGFEIPPR